MRITILKLFILLLVVGHNGTKTFAQNSKGLFEFQNYKSTSEYLNAGNFKYADDDLFIFENFESFYDFNGDGYLRGPVIYVFNSDGIFLEEIDPTEVEQKLSNFKRIQKKPKKNAFLIDKWLSSLVNYKTLEKIQKQENVDYYFVLNWAIFFNKPEKIKELFKWYEVLSRQKSDGQKIQIILFNMDLQDTWNLSEEKKASILSQANK